MGLAATATGGKGGLTIDKAEIVMTIFDFGKNNRLRMRKTDDSILGRRLICEDDRAEAGETQQRP